MNNNYSKRQGTSGSGGQLYETKLLGLINFRFLHYDDIETFHLATNVAHIGSFDDICFRVTIKGEKPFFVFIQSKHKENIKRLYSYKTEIGKNFKSYLTVRHKFGPKQEDVLFIGKFHETRCIFVIYSNAKNELTDLDESSFTDTLNELIGTGGNVKRPFDSVGEFKYLCELAVKDQITQLAGRMVTFMNYKDKTQKTHKKYKKHNNKENEEYTEHEKLKDNKKHEKLKDTKERFENIMKDELVRRYHVIMRQKVFQVSDIYDDKDKDPDKRHRMATFRPEFFENNEEHITLFREALSRQILKERKLTDDDKHNLEVFLTNPLDVRALSKLIITVISYNNGQLKVVKGASSLKHFQQKLRTVYVPQLTVNKAIEMAAKEILTGKKFKVPTTFGNIDLTINDGKRLDFVAKILSDLLEKSDTKEITIGERFLKLNGDIASTVGNVLVLDTDTKYFKFTDNCKGLAKDLFEKLSNKIKNLHEYKFNLKVRLCPKLSFDCSLYEEDIARDFLNKLLFFTEQSNEAGVGEQLKKEIEEKQLNYVNNILVNTDDIFNRYHEQIIEWWKGTAKEMPYLTKSSKMFEKVIDDILKDRLMSLVTYMTNINIKKCSNYIFETDAVKHMELQLQKQNILIAENCWMLLAKVIQYLKLLREEEMTKLSLDTNNECEKQTDDKLLSSDTNNTRKKHKKRSLLKKLTFLDLEYLVFNFRYILKLSKNEFKALSAELSSANDKRILIFVCDEIQNTEHVRKSLKSIAENIGNRKVIVITNKTSVDTIKKYFIQTGNVIRDDKHSLVDLKEESRKNILKNAIVKFQGKEVSLDLILDTESVKYITGEVLNCVINQKTIVVGKTIGHKHYDKTSYLDGRVQSNENGADIKTLHDIDDDVVIVTAKPGMGKSTLLTHLSLETKKIDPKVWIIRINLLEHSTKLSQWNNTCTNSDIWKTLNFMCHVILHEKFGKKHQVQISLEEVDGVVKLKDCKMSGDEDKWTVFELELFLHFYNREQIIFLFDGFDEIFSSYKNQVLECLKSVRKCPQKHKIWITSRPYNEIESKLREEFGISHEMRPLSYSERAIYLAKFWESNLILNEFDSRQLENVYNFIQYISESERHDHPGFEFERFLYEIYVSASLYLINEIKNTHIPLWKYEINNIYVCIEEITESLYMDCIDDDSSDGTPLLLHLTADYFLSLIKAKGETFKWNLDISTFDIYDKYLEKKLKIRVEEKYETDIYTPDYDKYFKGTLANLILKHKQLGAFAIFHDFSEKLFNKKELKKVMNTIKFIENADGETGHICKVANGIPIFAHITFTEYYAMEYICDVLKNEHRTDKHKTVLYLIFNEMFAIVDLNNVRCILDHKLKIDQTLKNILLKNKDFIFDILLKQGNKHSEYITSLRKKHQVTQGNAKSSRFNKSTGKTYNSIHKWALSEAISGNLSNVNALFMSIFESNLSEQNLDVFLNILIGTNVLVLARSNVCNEFLIFILDYVRKNAKSKLNSMITDNFPYLNCLKNYEDMTSNEIIDEIQNEYMEQLVKIFSNKLHLTDEKHNSLFLTQMK